MLFRSEESDAHQTHPVGISLDGQNADESDTSDQFSGDFSSEDELPSAVAESVSAGQSWPSKRKWVAEENATPSATPLSASSFGEIKTNGENQDLAVNRSMVQVSAQSFLGISRHSRPQGSPLLSCDAGP